jgi:hypothetical protein
MFDIIPMKRKCSMVVVPLLWMDAVLVVVLLLDAEFRSGMPNSGAGGKDEAGRGQWQLVQVEKGREGGEFMAGMGG